MVAFRIYQKIAKFMHSATAYIPFFSQVFLESRNNFKIQEISNSHVIHRTVIKIRQKIAQVKQSLSAYMPFTGKHFLRVEATVKLMKLEKICHPYSRFKNILSDALNYGIYAI